MLATQSCASAFSKSLDSDIRHHCKSRKSQIRIKYFKEYCKLSDDSKYDVIYERIPSSIVKCLDNKRQFGEIMINSPYVPKTYFSIDDLPDIDTIWFVKHQNGTRGHAVKCMTTQELKSYQLGKREIIQTAVTDLDLIDGCKYTIRGYLLFYDGKMYLYNDGCCIKHGIPYDAKNTDHSIQINHRGYDEDDSSIKLIPLSENPSYKVIFENMMKMMKNMQHLLQPCSNFVSGRHYAIWGIDILVEKNLNVKMIEMNIGPNLNQIKHIRKSVTYKMLNNMIRLIIGLSYEGFYHI